MFDDQIVRIVHDGALAGSPWMLLSVGRFWAFICEESAFCPSTIAEAWKTYRQMNRGTVEL